MCSSPQWSGSVGLSQLIGLGQPIGWIHPMWLTCVLTLGIKIVGPTSWWWWCDLASSLRGISVLENWFCFSSALDDTLTVIEKNLLSPTSVVNGFIFLPYLGCPSNLSIIIIFSGFGGSICSNFLGLFLFQFLISVQNLGSMPYRAHFFGCSGI